MSKIANLKAKVFLACFSDVAGSSFDKLCNDIDSFIGRCVGTDEANIITKQSGWQVGTKGRLTSKEGNTLQMPLNDVKTALVQFGLNITRIAENGSIDEPAHKMVIQANMPAVCNSWFNEHYRNTKRDVAVKA